MEAGHHHKQHVGSQTIPLVQASIVVAKPRLAKESNSTIGQAAKLRMLFAHKGMHQTINKANGSTLRHTMRK